MSVIHQVYCTHCTYGTSALERRQDELAERPLGYGPRASSLETKEALRECFRDVERFLYYYLPSDTPHEEFLRLDAFSPKAPPRFFYYPSTRGRQMLGQVCYRPEDTSGRPGSYFAHVLVSEPDSEPWSPAKCLELWGASFWVREDKNIRSFDLEPRNSFAEFLKDPQGTVRGGVKPAIGGKVLASFLTTPPGKDFKDDPGGVIPERWKNESKERRRKLLTEILDGFLHLPVSGRQQSVLLVVEPSLAALLFYGVASLLPDAIARRISFSTYEPYPDRLTVALAATCFHSSDETDLEPGVYRRPGFAYNTFTGKTPTNRPSQTEYAKLVVDTLARDGLEAAGEMLDGFQSARDLQGLESKAKSRKALARNLELAPKLLDPDNGPTKQELDGLFGADDTVREQVARVVRCKLAALSPDSPQLRALARSDNRLPVLKLIATEAGAGIAEVAVNVLLADLPGNQFPELLASKDIAPRFKATALVDFVNKARRFPENCGSLWDAKAASAPRPRQSGAPAWLLPIVLERLNGAVLEQLSESVETKHRELFLVGLIQACPVKLSGCPDMPAPPHVNLVTRQIRATDDAQLCKFLDKYAAAIQPYPRWHEKAMGSRLDNLLEQLPDDAAHKRFAGRLNVLQSCAGCSSNLIDKLGPWERIRDNILKLRSQPQEEAPGLIDRLFTAPEIGHYHKIGLALAGHANQAMSASRYTADAKRSCLQNICEELLGTSKLLPDEVWEDMFNYFLSGGWPTRTQLEGRRRRRRNAAARSLFSSLFNLRNAIILGVFAGAVVLYVWRRHQVMGGDERDSRHGVDTQVVDGTPVKPDSKEPPSHDEPGAEGPADSDAAPPTAEGPKESEPPEPAPAAGPEPGAEQAEEPEPGAAEPAPPDAEPGEDAEPSGAEPAEGAEPPAVEQAEPAMPTAEEPEPAEAAPDEPTPAPAQPPAQAAGPKWATVYADLPDLEAAIASADKDKWNTPVLIANLPPRPKNYSFALHYPDPPQGQAAESERRFQGTKRGGEPNKLLSFNLSLPPHQPPIARFWMTMDGKLSFRWDTKLNAAEDLDCAKRLHDCVLEVRGDEGPHFIALSKPIELDNKLPFKDGVAAIRFNELKPPNDGGPQWHNPTITAGQFFLGHGKVHLLKKDDYATFGDKTDKGEKKLSYPVESLAARWPEAQAVRIDLANFQQQCQLRIVLEKSDARIAEEQGIKDEIDRLEGEKIENATDMKEIEGYLKTINPKAEYPPKAKAGAANKLAAIVGARVRALPRQANYNAINEYHHALAAYSKDVERDIYKPGQQKFQELRNRNEQIDGQLAELRGKLPDRLRELRAVSVVLYRMVGGIRVNSLIFGEPD